ncbi:hypothetical protein ACQPWW_22595 [Micromonospora sp. CA-240977]|uniref:hypothetical protein n=1 Tax=Micromonospora sp. CA-240977 TaxID=3239957 RepID=UPI003D8ED1EE
MLHAISAVLGICCPYGQVRLDKSSRLVLAQPTADDRHMVLSLDDDSTGSPGAVTVHDEAMTGVQRTVVWAAVLSVGVVVVGLGIFVGVTRLDDADKWGSVVGALVAVLGLPLAGYGVVLARRPSSAAGRQSVTGSVIGGGVTQVGQVRGNVRIGGTAWPLPTAAAPPGAVPGSGTAGPGEPASQAVTGAWTAGPVQQVNDVGGDVDIDR